MHPRALLRQPLQKRHWSEHKPTCVRLRSVPGLRTASKHTVAWLNRDGNLAVVQAVCADMLPNDASAASKFIRVSYDPPRPTTFEAISDTEADVGGARSERAAVMQARRQDGDRAVSRAVYVFVMRYKGEVVLFRRDFQDAAAHAHGRADSASRRTHRRSPPRWVRWSTPTTSGSRSLSGASWGASPPRPPSLARHTHTHTLGIPYTCAPCGDSFVLPSLYKEWH